MRHARIERWSRGTSFLHGRHAAAKILAALTLLVCIATLTPHTMYCCAAYLLILAGAVAMAKLPVARVLLGAAAVLPFA
ncbi:MAG: hypothetical protein ABUS49_05130, partial [Acidobacteriota bacterium]